MVTSAHQVTIAHASERCPLKITVNKKAEPEIT